MLFYLGFYNRKHSANPKLYILYSKDDIVYPFISYDKTDTLYTIFYQTTALHFK